MEDSEDSFDYKVKFVDIRAGGRKGRGRKNAASAEPQTRNCSEKGCDQKGEHPAPKRDGDGRLWFCKKHAAEYNKAFNFFEDMSDEDMKDFNAAAKHGHKTTWKFGSGPVGRERMANTHNPRFAKDRDAWKESGANVPKRRSKLETKALNELDLKDDATAEQIRARYGEYVRTYHPDANQGDRSTEEKLARVIKAGKTLKSAGLMK